jgi:hypothetical protein
MSVPVAKLILGALYRERTLWERAVEKLVELYGPLDPKVIIFPFDCTDYYRAEMGSHLVRLFCSFREPVPQEELAGAKTSTNALERVLAGRDKGEVKRGVNLDPGLLTLSNLVLATTKGYSHRIYLKDGIYAEVTLIFQDDGFRPLEWTYPDYRMEQSLSFFNSVRRDWRTHLRAEKK